ncbi:hypothetical protein C8F01DRAFT_1261886 [Mycena amicta]|nr:hypothetical protein C8F01DRAFT_1261886 [Mycena amicta]
MPAQPPSWKQARWGWKRTHSRVPAEDVARCRPTGDGIKKSPEAAASPGEARGLESDGADGATLLDVLSLMKLPALKNLTILSSINHESLRNLLRAHGNSLKTLVILIDNLNGLVSTSRSNGVLHLCPNLTELTILCRNVLSRFHNSTFPATNMLHSATPVRALTKIKIILPATVWAKSSTLKWETFFADFSNQVKRTIPNLQEVQLGSAPSWPTNE